VGQAVPLLGIGTAHSLTVKGETVKASELLENFSERRAPRCLNAIYR
jgi:hypothetical protein